MSRFAGGSSDVVGGARTGFGGAAKVGTSGISTSVEVTGTARMGGEGVCCDADGCANGSGEVDVRVGTWASRDGGGGGTLVEAVSGSGAGAGGVGTFVGSGDSTAGPENISSAVYSPASL